MCARDWRKLGAYMALSKNMITPPNRKNPPISKLLNAQGAGIDDDHTHRLNRKPLLLLKRSKD